MAAIIQLRPQGGTKRRYGSFAGRTPFIPPPVTQVTSTDVSGHGRPDRREGRGLTPRELAELNVAEALRNTPEPKQSPDTRKPVIPGKQTEIAPDPVVVRIDDYRTPPLDNVDAAIEKAENTLSAIAATLAAIQEAPVMRQIAAFDAALDDELAITLLMMD